MFNIKVDYPIAGGGETHPGRRPRATSRSELDQGAERQGDPQPAEAGAQRAGGRLRHRLRGPAGAGDAAERPDGAGLRQAAWWTGAPGRAPGIFLIQGGKAMAAMDGRFSVAIDDIKKVAIPVLRHRISTNFQAQAEGKTSEDIIQQLLTTIGDPEVAKYEKQKEA